MAANFYSAVSPRPLQGNGWLSSVPLLIDRQSAENLKNSQKYQRTVGYPSTSWASCTYKKISEHVDKNRLRDNVFCKPTFVQIVFGSCCFLFLPLSFRHYFIVTFDRPSVRLFCLSVCYKPVSSDNKYS